MCGFVYVGVTVELRRGGEQEASSLVNTTLANSSNNDEDDHKLDEDEKDNNIITAFWVVYKQFPNFPEFQIFGIVEELRPRDQAQSMRLENSVSQLRDGVCSSSWKPNLTIFVFFGNCL